MIRIRSAAMEDYIDVFSLMWLASSEVVSEYIGEQDYHKAMELCKSHYANENCQFYYKNCAVAEQDGSICGAVIFYDGADSQKYADYFSKISGQSLEAESERGFIYIDSIAVYEQYRGQGIAKLLLEYCYQAAQKSGTALTLLVSDEKPHAKALYEKYGFTENGGQALTGHQYYKMVRR